MHRHLTAIFFIALFAAVVYAQDPGLPPVITAAPASGGLRFSSSGPVCQIRVQILGADGATLADSDWKDGNVIDWPADGVSIGSERYRVMVRDLEGRISQREGSFDRQTESIPKITLLAHDGANGSIVSTAGDLSFRFGDFPAGKDTEKMRLTSTGDLEVEGAVRAAGGILFPDGTLLTAEHGRLTTRATEPGVQAPDARVETRVIPSARRTAASRPLQPSAITPTYSLITTHNGVGIWNSSPAFPLDVAGVVNAGDSYYIAGGRALASDAVNYNVFVGDQAGAANTLPSGADNTFVGKDAGTLNTTGYCNTFLGTSAGSLNTTGQGNTVIGVTVSSSAMGDNNVLIGRSADLSSGSESVAIGYGAATGALSGGTNMTAIGAHARAEQDNTVVIGSINGVNGATATASVGIGTRYPNQNLGVGGGITVDQHNLNDGTLLTDSVLSFGSGASNGMSGEAIASRRTTGGNRYGLDFYTNSINRISITQSGYIGIGTGAPTTNFELAIGKTTLADAWTTRSSARFKDNIRPIDSALDKVESLRGVSFDYKDSGKHSIGFIAEEVAKVVPEAVQRDENGEPIGLDYERITPLLVEALKAQETVISDLKESNRSLEERLAKLEAVIATKRE